MQRSNIKFYCFVTQTLLNMSQALFCPSSGACQTAIAASGFLWMWCVLSRLRTNPPPHSYGNLRLQWQIDGLLMIPIIMPETCWAVSPRQSNTILQLIVGSSRVFYLSEWRCTKPQTLNRLMRLLSVDDFLSFFDACVKLICLYVFWFCV
jgi:hypothetical protein